MRFDLLVTLIYSRQKREDSAKPWSIIIEDDRHWIEASFNRNQKYISYSLLQVRNISSNDGGEYRCVNSFVGEEKSTVATVTTYGLCFEIMT